ncbi:MAG: phosphatase PAP2 family protein [Chloroflexi bacterium]|nr:phosphatase PAP2 family protein [Chloroflexota bacterium]
MTSRRARVYRLLLSRIARAYELILIFSIAALLFGGLTFVALGAEPTGFDLAATRWLQIWSNPTLTAAMQAISFPGYRPYAYVLPLIVAAGMFFWFRFPEAAWLLGSQAVPLSNALIKAVIHRPRPSPTLVDVYSAIDEHSFPSGHVLQYTTLFGFAFFLFYVLAPPSRMRTAALVGLALLMVLVAPSRLYLGHHWLSDVLGGYALALLFLIPYCWAYTRFRLPSARPVAAQASVPALES